MKRITSKNDRCLLLKKLRTAVCLQIMLWDQCSKLSEILGDCENDAVLLVNRITRQHGGKELQLSDLDAIQAAFSKINFGVAVKKLSRSKRHTLLAVMQSAVRLQKELCLPPRLSRKLRVSHGKRHWKALWHSPLPATRGWN